MKREFMVERQGRWFVLYAGLLDEAHSQGLKAIRTQLIQVPSGDNGHLAICAAQVETERGLFSGLGDASPDSVPRMMLPHLIRMAETRSKARALRDAINCGAAALEELAETEDSSDQDQPSVAIRETAVREVSLDGSRAGEAVAQPRPLQPRPPAVAPVSATNGGLATPNQVRAIYLIARDQQSLSEGQVDERARELYGSTPAELTRKQASDLITSLKARAPLARAE